MKTNHFQMFLNVFSTAFIYSNGIQQYTDYDLSEKEPNQHLWRNKQDWNEFMNGLYLRYKELWKV